MSVSEEELQKIRENVCEEVHRLINTVKKLHDFDNLSLGSQRRILDQIWEGFADATDLHQPDDKKSPE